MSCELITPEIKEPVLDESKCNAHKIVCAWCGCIILSPGVGSLVTKEVSMHRPRVMRGEAGKTLVTEMEVVSNHWLVTDQYQFENIGVSKPIDADNLFRYLCCADCDGGPVGIVYSAAPSEFYVTHERVAYQ